MSKKHMGHRALVTGVADEIGLACARALASCGVPVILTDIDLKGMAPAELVARVPIGCVGQPDDVAAAVRYLVSGEAALVSGTTLDVNGGYRM